MLKGGGTEQNKFIGLKVFRTMLVFVFTQSSNLWGQCLQPPTKHSALTAPNHLEATLSIKREGDEACVFAFRGMTVKDIKTPGEGMKTKSRGLCLCVCVFL